MKQSEATAAVRSLRKAYRTYLRGGQWQPCDDGYRALCALVRDNDRRAQLNHCIETATDGGALTPVRAITRLLRQEEEFYDIEGAFASQMGFGRGSHKKWINTAVRQADRLGQRHQVLPGCKSAAAVLALLDTTHQLVRQSGTRAGGLVKRRARTQTRKLALRELDRRLYVIGMLLANGEEDYRNLFNLSYSISSGVAAFPPKPRRRVPEDLCKRWCTWPADWRANDVEPPTDDTEVA